MKLTDEQHDELLALTQELKAFVAAGYASPTGIWDSRLDRITEILWSVVDTGEK